ncbi:MULTISPECIES: restriction endonuclease subunit S [unclassified Flavobacterium]|jgi:type I restriction enzyme S subunit|uniref:restriction endonuclease subunit S n=1 Tax=unclassified Flavobacterium TaxID=196869 RepID=UPI0025C1C7F2|nr:MULTISPECIES: restriction endonuclease subunit S [unclassified Flavobacterium]
MKKYDNYKDSGIEWIGEIPKHWDCFRLKNIVKAPLKYGANESAEDDNPNNPRYIRITDFGADGLLKDDTFKSLPLEVAKNYFLEDGDLLFARSGATVGKTFLFKNYDGIACYAGYLIKASFDKNYINSTYIDYITRSNYYENWKLSIFQQATIQNIGADKFNLFNIPIPNNIEEQTQIAKYLDHKTNQIDTLISKKKQFINLLQEERIAVINQAVTKGLDPKVKMKDSGIEWLGEIPEHWEVKRMKYLCDVTTGGKDTENREDNGKYPFFVRSQTIERISSYSFDGEAILTAGDGVGVCKVWHYVNEKFDFHQRVYMMSNFKPVLGKYLFYYLKENFGKEVMKLSAKSTVDSLRRPMFQNFMVCFGSLEEQKEIINQIEKEDIRIETLISKSQQEIELLKEYKTALISEVVTGKVDVREEILN